MPKYLRYQKIAQTSSLKKQRNPQPGKCPFYSKGTRFLMAFELPNGISFAVKDSLPHPEGRKIYSKWTYKLRIFDKKDGTKGFNFYKLRNTFPRIVPPKELLEKFVVPKTKKQAAAIGLSKTANLRLYRFIKKFCQRHKVNIRWHSKDPFCLITQLCYPGTMNLDDKTILKLAPDVLMKKPVWRALCTNGSRTKRLLLECFKKHPQASNFHLHIARYINQKYGLDKAQEFLEQRINHNTPVFNVTLPKEIIKQLKRLNWSSDRVLNSLNAQPWLVSDTFRMLETTEQIPEHDNIQDLHDKLSANIRRVVRTYPENKEVVVPKYNVLKKLTTEWDDPEYSILLPQTGQDLIDWSIHMGNCVASYIRQIAGKTYYILAITKDGEIKYNIGFNLVPITKRGELSTESAFSFSQWSGKYNRPIEPELQERFKQQFAKANIIVGRS